MLISVYRFHARFPCTNQFSDFRCWPFYSFPDHSCICSLFLICFWNLFTLLISCWTLTIITITHTLLPIESSPCLLVLAKAFPKSINLGKQNVDNKVKWLWHVQVWIYFFVDRRHFYGLNKRKKTHHEIVMTSIWALFTIKQKTKKFPIQTKKSIFFWKKIKKKFLKFYLKKKNIFFV